MGSVGLSPLLNWPPLKRPTPRVSRSNPLSSSSLSLSRHNTGNKTQTASVAAWPALSHSFLSLSLLSHSFACPISFHSSFYLFLLATDLDLISPESHTRKTRNHLQNKCKRRIAREGKRKRERERERELSYNQTWVVEEKTGGNS